jgi:hypothetical protein
MVLGRFRMLEIVQIVFQPVVELMSPTWNIVAGSAS